MDAAIFKVRNQTKKDVQADIEGLSLSKNEGGSYTHEDAQVFINEIRAILAKQFFNAGDGTNGMENLLANHATAANALTERVSTETTTRQMVLAASKAEAAAAPMVEGVAVTPDIETNADAQDEADRKNMFLLSLIGAKEGVAAGVATIVGSAITDPVLRTADSTTLKHVDKFHLYELMKAVIEGADRPATGDVRIKYGQIVATTFDFRTKMVTCVELLSAKIEKMGTYGINMSEAIIVMIVLANVEEAAKWSPEHRIALTAIRAKYPYEHPHDADSMKYVLARLAVADESRDRRNAPAPGRFPVAAAVDNADSQIGALSDFINDFADEDTVDGEANAVIEDGWVSAGEGRGRSKSKKRSSRHRSRSPVSSRSPSTSRSPSPPRRHRRSGRDHRRSSRHSGRDSSRYRRSGRSRARNDSGDEEPNNCKHCNAIDPPRKNCTVGGGSKAKCLWNPDYKGWRPDWVCGRMGIVFKKKGKFTKELGGTKEE